MDEDPEEQAIEEFLDGGHPGDTNVAGEPAASRVARDAVDMAVMADATEPTPPGTAEETPVNEVLDYEAPVVAEAEDLMAEYGLAMKGSTGVHEPHRPTTLSFPIPGEDGADELYLAFDTHGQMISVGVTGSTGRSDYNVRLPFRSPKERLDEPVEGYDATVGGLIEGVLTGDLSTDYFLTTERVSDFPDPAMDPARLKDDRDSPEYH